MDVRVYLRNSHLPLVFFGAGGTAEGMAHYCEWYSIRIDGICDSNPARQGGLFHCLTIFAPEELPARFPTCNVMITVVHAHEKAVYDRLLGLGVPEHHIFRYGEVDVIAPFLASGFSVYPHRDLFRFGRYFADEESRRLYRLRYRHWLLADRPRNPEVAPLPVDFVRPGSLESVAAPGGIVLYPDASSLCDHLERFGAEAAKRDLALEFANRDPLAKRAFFTVRRFRDKGRFFLRSGTRPDTTLFYALTEGVHAP